MSLKKYKTVIGRHDFKPWEWPAFFFGSFELEFTLRFGSDCNYLLPGGDQLDWNKAGGFSDRLWPNNRDAAMVGWRYNPDVDKIEVVGYYNVNGQNLPASNPLIVRFDTDIKCTVRKDYRAKMYYVSMIDPATGFPHNSQQPANIKRFYAKFIGLWFGGNRPAPKVMTVWRSVKRK